MIRLIYVVHSLLRRFFFSGIGGLMSLLLDKLKLALPRAFNSLLGEFSISSEPSTTRDAYSARVGKFSAFWVVIRCQPPNPKVFSELFTEHHRIKVELCNMQGQKESRSTTSCTECQRRKQKASAAVLGSRNPA